MTVPKMVRPFTLMLACLAFAAAHSSTVAARQGTARAVGAEGFEKLKALQGEWIDVEGAFGKKDAVAVTYRVSGAGHTVLETFPAGSAEEMVTVYHMDGNDIVLTHYCSGGNQPRMRSKGLNGNVLTFDYDGGDNIDPAKTSHMHNVKIEFTSPDEIRATWTNWSNGKPDDHSASFRAVRKR